MKKINEIEALINDRQAAYDSDICNLLIKSYSNTQEAGNELLDISDIIWEHDYDALVNDMRRFGIEEFTVSSTFSSLLEAIDALLERGCTLEGMTKVNDRFASWNGGERELHAALLLKVN